MKNKKQQLVNISAVRISFLNETSQNDSIRNDYEIYQYSQIAGCLLWWLYVLFGYVPTFEQTNEWTDEQLQTFE